jgi:hypothetical protein
MKIPILTGGLPLGMAVLVIGLTATPVFSRGSDKAKPKTKDKSESIGKHGREDGELPYGLEHYTDKTGGLPSGLEKKKDDDGSLTRGLEEDGRRTKSTDKAIKNGK